MNLLKVDTIAQVNEKLDRYFSKVLLETEVVDLSGAAGRYLAEDILADAEMPAFPRSVVDGYAVRAQDTFGVSESVPVFLKIVGESIMGRACSLAIRPGETVYVPTGAMLPAGSDAVIMIEYTEALDRETVAIYKPAAPNNGIMNRGEDFSKGACLLRLGQRITEKEIGTLACIGKTKISVYRKPRISLISSGDELIGADEKPDIGQIRDINSHILAAHIKKCGGEIISSRVVKDDFETFQTAAKEALAESDLMLISGGSSAGNKDMTEKVIASLGAPGVFTHGIAVKPGKPTILGAVGEGREAKLAVGLPGHPMSALMVYMTVVEPFVKKVYFHNQENPFTITATLPENVHAGEGRETFLPVVLSREQGGTVFAFPIHAKSGSIAQLIKADGFIRFSVDSEGAVAGSAIEVILIHS